MYVCMCMEITSFTLNKFRPWRIFRGRQICNDEYTSKNSKNVDFDCIMKAFFDECKYHKDALQEKTKMRHENTQISFHTVLCTMCDCYNFNVGSLIYIAWACWLSWLLVWLCHKYTSTFISVSVLISVFFIAYYLQKI